MNNNSKNSNFMSNFVYYQPSVDPYSFENIGSSSMPDINDKYFYLKHYILDAVKNIQPKYYELDLSDFDKYTENIEGWKGNIDNNHKIISVLIDRALIKAGVDRKIIKNCLLSEEYFIVHDREFPIDALNHGSISVYDKDYDATITSNEKPYTAFSIYKTGYDKKEDDESIKDWLLRTNFRLRKPAPRCLFGDTEYAITPNTTQHNKKKVSFTNELQLFYSTNFFYNKLTKNTINYSDKNTNGTDKNKYNINKIKDCKDKYYDFTQKIKPTLFTQIYNILLDYDKTQEYDVSIAGNNIKNAENNDIIETAKNIGIIFEQQSKEQDIDLISYGINSLKYMLSKVDEKGYYDKTDITKNNNDMIPLFRVFILKYDDMIQENLGSKRLIGSSCNTASI
jgi:hypothetical protein